MTLVKTSVGGFNMDHVVSWYWEGKRLKVILLHSDQEIYNHLLFDSDESSRVAEILNNRCEFDATKQEPDLVPA
jgi:hypothetical protein